MTDEDLVCGKLYVYQEYIDPELGMSLYDGYPPYRCPETIRSKSIGTLYPNETFILLEMREYPNYNPSYKILLTNGTIGWAALWPWGVHEVTS